MPNEVVCLTHDCFDAWDCPFVVVLPVKPFLTPCCVWNAQRGYLPQRWTFWCLGLSICCCLASKAFIDTELCLNCPTRRFAPRRTVLMLLLHSSPALTANCKVCAAHPTSWTSGARLPTSFVFDVLSLTKALTFLSIRHCSATVFNCLARAGAVGHCGPLSPVSSVSSLATGGISK